ncbi:MAG TPA: 50S ribosomal protein L17 [Candidatus Paceibacterota bacterium]|jgi:large subunit ribosomal protein L17
MRHHKNTRTLGRSQNQRRALLRHLARSLILEERIQTTEAKAKELRPFVERLVTKSKHDTLSSRRLILERLGNETVATRKLFAVIGPRYQERAGGYTRITKLATAKADARKMAQIEFV